MGDFDASVIIPLGEGDRPESMLCTALEKQTWPLGKFEVLFIGADLDSRSIIAQDERRIPGSVAMLHIRVPRTVEPDLIHRAARAAKGDCLICLGPDLLPSTHFVEAHITAHREQEGWGLAYGISLPHPQLRPGKFTRWTLPGEKPASDASGEVSGHELVTCCGNFSMLRDRYFDLGGLPGGYFTTAITVAALGGRVRRKGGRIFHVPRARALLWRSTDLNTLRRWMYLRGMDIHTLKNDEPDLHELLVQLYRLDRFSIGRLFDGFYHPTRLKICRQSPQDVRVLGGILERLLIHERYMGYRDATRFRRPVWNPISGPALTAAINPDLEEPTN